MSWSTPPSFSDGSLLSAAQLNILSDDVEFLYGALSGVNVPFRSLTSGSDLSKDTNIWKFRYLGRYLHYRVRLTSGQHDVFRLYYDDNEYVIDDGSRSAPYTWASYIDLNSLGLTVGQFYNATWRWQFSSSGSVTLDYLLQSDSTSL